MPAKEHLIYLAGTPHLTKQTRLPQKPLSCCGFWEGAVTVQKTLYHCSVLCWRFPLWQLMGLCTWSLSIRPIAWVTAPGQHLHSWSCTWANLDLVTVYVDPICFSEKSGRSAEAYHHQQWTPGCPMAKAEMGAHCYSVCAALLGAAGPGNLQQKVGTSSPSGSKVLNHHSCLVSKHIVSMPLIKEQLLPKEQSEALYLFPLVYLPLSDLLFPLQGLLLLFSFIFFLFPVFFFPVMAHQSAILSL